MDIVAVFSRLYEQESIDIDDRGSSVDVSSCCSLSLFVHKFRDCDDRSSCLLEKLSFTAARPQSVSFFDDSDGWRLCSTHSNRRVMPSWLTPLRGRVDYYCTVLATIYFCDDHYIELLGVPIQTRLCHFSAAF